MDMPQPLKPGCVLHYHYGVVKERPNHAIGIALVASTWTALEADLILMFTSALFDFAFASREQEAARVARKAWEAMESIRLRLEFIGSVLKHKISDDLFTEFVEKIEPEIRRRSKERNRVVHGYWCTSPECPEDLVLHDEISMRYTIKDFEDIASRINGTLLTVAEYWRQVKEQVNPVQTVIGVQPLPLRSP
jgi:hypothetical protein